MANYRLGDIIRLTRKSIGMSQEELAFEAGVATETISRIESGKHKVTQTTYQKIMEPLNRFTDRSYAICTGKNMGIVEAKRLLEDAEVKFEYEKAAEYLEDLKERVDDNVVNRQYIMRAQTLCDYDYYKTIDAETMAERLEDALRLTVENYHDYLDYDNYKEDGYPFTEQEIVILMNIASAYDERDMTEKAEKILCMLLDCLNSGYIWSREMGNLKIAIKRNLSRVMQGQGRYEESLMLLEEILEESLKTKYGPMVSLAAYDITWNMVKLNEISDTQRYDLEEIKRKKRQTYYVAAARNDNHVKQLAKKSYEKLFGEDFDI